MLSLANESLVLATMPVVGANIDAISGVFYDTLAENPELLDLFSRSGQATGDAGALAGAVVAFATDLVGTRRGASFEPVVRRIAHKHASLGICPEQYTMVGRYLLGAVGTVLGDAVTPEIAAAWDEVYWLFATRLIGMESRLYANSDIDPDHPGARSRSVIGARRPPTPDRSC